MKSSLWLRNWRWVNHKYYVMGSYIDQCGVQETFKRLTKEAKHHVQEPPQPKIKLKVPQSSETPTHPKKITIHVGGKSSAAGSPAPATGQPSEGEATRNGTPLLKNPFVSTPGGSANHNQLDKARSVSASAPSPGSSAVGVVKPEDAAKASPAIAPHQRGTTTQQFAPIMPPPNIGTNGVTPQPPPPPPPPKLTATDILEAQKYRPSPISK